LKIVIKFGGTSIATVKDIKNVVKIVNELSNKNKLIVVCSAVDGITDELIKISNQIRKENKKEANRILASISQKHKQYATHLISDSKIQKSLLRKTESDLQELEEKKQQLLVQLQSGDVVSIEAAMDALAEKISILFPPRSFPAIRENIEVIVVAIAVAMAFRSYFLQPFKIPLIIDFNFDKFILLIEI